MDEKKLKNAVFVDNGVFSEDIVIKSVYSFDCKTLVTLVLFGDVRVMFTIYATNSNVVFKTIFGALHGFSLHSCLDEMVKHLHDIYDISHITIDFDYEKD